MKKWKKILAPLLAAAMVFSAVPFSFAAVEDTGFSDVSAGSWYADAVEYVSDNGLMSGTDVGGGLSLFRPNYGMTRAQLAMILYRFAGGEPVAAPQQRQSRQRASLRQRRRQQRRQPLRQRRSSRPWQRQRSNRP